MITKSSSSCTYHTRPQGMSVAAKQVEGHWAYETAYSSFSLASFLAYPLVGPLFIRATGGLRFVYSTPDGQLLISF